MRGGLKIAFVYIGLIIGAGFASGREIMQYFNFRSNTDYSGIVLSSLLFIVLCYIILNKASRLKLSDFDEYVNAVAGRAARGVKAFMLLYMFCGFFVMLAGSGALLKNSFACPALVGILLMALICFAVFAFDIKGIVLLNGILVPLMLAGILYIGISSIIFNDTQAFYLFYDIKNNMLFSALCYVSYNTITAAAVLVPLARNAAKKELITGALIGGGILGILICVIWIALGLHFGQVWYSEIPMFQLAEMNGVISKWVYSAVLLMSICTTAVSQGFGILSYCKAKTLKKRVLCGGIICLLAIPFSLLGFGHLVEHLYAFFGYCGLVWMLWVIIDYTFRRNA